MTEELEESARKLLEVVPIIMQDIRSEMRGRRSLDLTVPQFRALAFVNRNEGSSLWEVAHHMGLTPPSTSRLVDNLIERGLMARNDHPGDRRRVRLTVTVQGLAILEASTQGTVSYLADKLSGVNADNREVIDKAVETLRTVFAAST
ncbi:MAG TPA: MarR family transcriptional regulator [Candidatus Bathyarchaeia archaeon]|nr:MarR family transcriptional regulator [Candidatus Bathyarchaeia archaeon]